MSNPTPRPTRSRISSPFVPAPLNAAADSKNTVADASQKPKTFLDRWVEPPLPTPRASYVEAGIERYGVVQNMAPLGTRPSTKVMKSATRSEGEGPARMSSRRGMGASTVSTPSESVMTPEPPTISERRRSTSGVKAEDIEPEPRTPKTPKTPQQQTNSWKTAGRQSVGSQIAGQGVFQLQQSPIPISTSMSRPTPSPFQAPPTPVTHTPGPALGPDGLPIINLDQTDRVVEHAVQEALDRRRWPTAYALRTIYDDHRTDPAMVRLFEAIYNERATDEELANFAGILRKKKIEGKKDRTGEYYFNGDGSDPPPFRPFLSAINAINPPPTTPYQTPYTPLPRSGSVQASSFNQSSVSASPQKETEHAHINKKHRSNSFQPVNGEVNGDGSAHGEGKAGSPRHANGTSKSTPNKKRSDSMSSSSSLSSVDEGQFNGEFSSSTISSSSIPGASQSSAAGAAPPGEAAGSVGTGPSGLGLAGLGFGFGAAAQAQPPIRFSPYASANNFQRAASSAETLVRNQQRPISAPHKPGPRTYTFSTVTTTPPAVALSSSAKSPNTTTSTSAVNHQSSPTKSTSSMAPVALVVSSSSSSSGSISASAPPSASFKAKNSAKAPVPLEHEFEPRTRSLKRQARQKTASAAQVEDSFERHQVSVPSNPETESASDGEAFIAARKPSKRGPKVRLLNNRETRQSQSNRYDSDDLSSPTLLGFQPDLAPGSLAASRAGTPNLPNRPTRKTKTGKGLRVKTSPMKKKGGTLAGIPRASGERDSPVGNGAFFHHQDDNDDYCSACGGNGELVCCDNCTRSFHFKCVDPPMIEGNLPDEWYCNHCLSSLDRQVTARLDDLTGGTFGLLLSHLDGKNPSAFTLPKGIREYFENVKTGADGEYEESGGTKPKGRGGYDEAPDYFRLKDPKGKAILCYQCHKAASQPDSMIIPCSFCGLYWHLNCVPNPMAKEPGPGRQWRCPAHVDDLLSIIPAALGPAHRFRKIKGAPVIKPAISRGIRNTGHIEIENEPSEDEEEQGFYERREFGHVYKLPEQGIKLDFISKVKREGGGYTASRFAVQSRPKLRRTQPVYTARSLAEQQAALNLIALMDHEEPVLDSAGILINALLIGAPLEAIELIARGQADNIQCNKLGDGEKQTLRTLRAVIDEKLSASDKEERVAAPTPAPTPSLTVEKEVVLETTPDSEKDHETDPEKSPERVLQTPETGPESTPEGNMEKSPETSEKLENQEDPEDPEKPENEKIPESPVNTTEDVPEDMTDIPEGIPENLPEDSHDKGPEEISEAIPGEGPEDIEMIL